MHLGNGAVTPECGLFALGAAAVGVGAAYCSARAAGVDRAQARTAGALATAVFAAQSFNVQIAPFSSVHLIGGTLLAWVLGPSLGLLTMTGILALQALLVGDGGLLALGANIVNMGLIPALAVALIRRHAHFGESASRPASTRSMFTLGATAFACTIAAAGLIVLEVAVGRTTAQLDGLGAFASTMLGAHLSAGLLEAVVTVAIVGCLAGAYRHAEARPHPLVSAHLSANRAAVIVAASLAVAAFSVPSFGLASSAPDGYEASIASLQQSGHALGSLESVQPAGGWMAAVQQWQASFVSLIASLAGPEVLVVMFATAVAGLAGWGLARACARDAWQPIS